MLTANICVDALGPLDLLADTAVAPHQNDLSGPLTAEQRAMAENVSAFAVYSSSIEVVESSTPAVADGCPPSVLAIAEAGEVASGPLAISLPYAAYIRPELFLARAKLMSAVASDWVPSLVASGMATRHRCIAFARAEANAVRLSESAANSRPAKTGDQRLDALARLVSAISNCRLDAWALLAELRAASCITVKASELASARHDLVYARQRLYILTTRRQQALRDGGKAEAVFQSKTERSRRAAELRELYLDRAGDQENCLFIEEGEAAHQLIYIQAAIYRYRADAWDHIAECQERSARGVMPDPAAVADLHHCRLRIAELLAELPTALAASRIEGEAQKSDRRLKDIAADARPDNAVAKADLAPVFASSSAIAVVPSPSAVCDDVPF
jgi:hypothetical protein